MRAERVLGAVEVEVAVGAVRGFGGMADEVTAEAVAHDLKGSRQDLKVLPLAYSLYFAQFALPFRSICTTFSLCEKVLSLERTKKNMFSFGSLLVYSYLCAQLKNRTTDE